jgi:hypothetical protein
MQRFGGQRVLGAGEYRLENGGNNVQLCRVFVVLGLRVLGGELVTEHID